MQQLDVRLREILLKGFGGTQSQLREELKRRGLDVNQSTVSRALQRLGARKSGGAWILDDDGKVPARAYQSIHEHILSMKRNEVVVFIKTIPGSAHYVASFLDGQDLPIILGTLA